MSVIALMFLVPSLWSGQGLATTKPSKTVLGRVERVHFLDHKFSLEARVDTGAHTSSLHVTGEVVTEEKGNRYISFTTEDRAGKKYRVKAKIHKESLVRNTSGLSSRRYVIRERVRVGNRSKLININLNDRTELKYNFLIGRNLLRGSFLVDVSKSHLTGD